MIDAARATQALIARVSEAPPEARRELMRWLLEDPRRAVRLRYLWKLWARPQQRAPVGEWTYWLIVAGRGWGKTRTAAEWIAGEVRSGRRRRLALISKDPRDARDVMVEGPSGLLNVGPLEWRPRYEPSNLKLIWPNGAEAFIYSAEDPDKLRGPEHDGAWADELCAWRFIRETWDNLRFGLRISGPQGHDPRCVVTTTPKPVKVLTEIRDDPDTIVTGGSTYENLSNLSKVFRKAILSKYEGTRVGRQEIFAEILEEVEGALWTRDLLEQNRVGPADVPALGRIVIAVDPMAKKNAKRKQSEPETGIIIAGMGEDEHGYVIGDYSVTNSKPDVWARKVIAAFYDFEADRVVGEVNNGGDMVEDVIRTRDPNIPFKMVTASRGKWTRAEPISALDEQAKIHHVGFFGDLETQMCTWTGEDNEPSPDRLDARVWALTELMLGSTVADVSPELELGTAPNPWRIDR